MNGPHASPPSDLETLAAFIEHRLPEAERRRVEERLARDEEFYEIYTETLQTLEELEAEPASASPISIGPRLHQRGRARLLSLAASLVVVSGFVLMWAMPRYFLGSTGPTGVSARLGDRADWDLKALHPTTRSAGDPASWTFEWGALGIHLGTHLIDLQVALEAGDWRAAERAAAQLAGELKGSLFFDGGTFEEMASSLEPPEARGDEGEHPGLAPDTRDRHLQTLAEQDELFEQTYQQLGLRAYHLGKWLESTRLMALSRDERPLRNRLGRLSAAERILQKDGFETYKLQRSEEILDRLKLLREADDPQALDFKAIAKLLEDLIVELGRESSSLEP